MKNTIRFIINPISGGKNKTLVPQQIEQVCAKLNIQADIYLSNSIQETIAQAKEAVEQQYETVVAVGGDGTINLIGAQLLHSSTALGIIPMGSGNGFARSLGLPFQIERAIKIIQSRKTVLIDTGTINEKPFINLSGAGFDAHIADKFQHSKSRGFFSYVNIVLREFNQYQAQQYHLNIDDEQLETDAFLITVCNGPQYGNNAFIAPAALMTDGRFHITVLKKCTWANAPSLAWRLFRGTIDLSKDVEQYSASSVQIKRKNVGPINIDGEPDSDGTELNFKLIPLSLKVIVP